MADELTVLTLPPNAEEGEIYQWFPANGSEASRDVAWRISWRFASRREGEQPSVPIVVEASLEREPGAGFLTLVRNLMLTDLWVLGPDAEPRDVLRADDWSWLQTKQGSLGPACIARGELLGSFFYKEVHDDQLRWKSFHNASRRGQVLTLWAAASTGRFQYVVEYGFTCDGSVMVRLGVFGPTAGEGAAAHLHVPCWSFEPDLGNSVSVEAALCALRQRGDGKADVVIAPFNDGKEGSAAASLEEFTSLRFVNPTELNRHSPPRPCGFDLFLTVEGRVPNVRYSFSDFVVTVAEKNDSAVASMVEAAALCQGRPLAYQRKRVYCATPIAHWPRAVHTSISNRPHTQWGGFHLRPRDLFAATPTYSGTFPTP